MQSPIIPSKRHTPVLHWRHFYKKKAKHNTQIWMYVEAWVAKLISHGHLVRTSPRIFTIIQKFRRLYSHLHLWMCIHWLSWLYSRRKVWIIYILGLVHTKYGQQRLHNLIHMYMQLTYMYMCTYMQLTYMYMCTYGIFDKNGNVLRPYVQVSTPVAKK